MSDINDVRPRGWWQSFKMRLMLAQILLNPKAKRVIVITERSMGSSIPTSELKQFTDWAIKEIKQSVSEAK